MVCWPLIEQPGSTTYRINNTNFCSFPSFSDQFHLFSTYISNSFIYNISYMLAIPSPSNSWDIVSLDHFWKLSWSSWIVDVTKILVCLLSLSVYVMMTIFFSYSQIMLTINSINNRLKNQLYHNRYPNISFLLKTDDFIEILLYTHKHNHCCISCYVLWQLPLWNLFVVDNEALQG